MKSSSLRSAPDRTPSPLDINGDKNDAVVAHPAPTYGGAVRSVWIASLLVAVGLLVAGAYYVGRNGFEYPGAARNPQNPSQIQHNSIAVPPAADPLFSGNLTRLQKDLSLFLLTEDDALNDVSHDQFVYYSAGTFLRGELMGYTRIIAIRPSIGPGGPLSYTLATKDYLTYILDDPEHEAEKPEDDWANPYMFLDRKKISSAAVFETEHTLEISLDGNFSLYRVSMPILSVQTAKKDAHDNVIYDTPLAADFSTYQILPSPVNHLSLYAKPYSTARNLGELNAQEKQKESARQTYFAADTDVVVVDSVGLPVTYTLTTPDAASTYVVRKKQYDKDVITYQEEVKKLKGYTDASVYPKYPDYVYLPHIGFNSSDVQKEKSDAFFKRYDQAIPGACATQLNTRVMNISGNDLERVATFRKMPVYRLKDSHHPLYTLAYANKLDYYDMPDSGWEEVNKGIKKPTLDEYVSQNPLLFIEDYWHRWVAIGEYDIQLPGGCGKPVIYLYPAKTTDVSVVFDAGIQLTTDIPTYSDSWLVRAHTDGSLTNLKPVSCSVLPIHTGSEYAKEACALNTYPYLYWSGNIRSVAYPYTKDGWVVPRDALADFLSDSLDTMGYTKKEAQDFMDYWVPEMLGKGMPYYRISFFQTRDVNAMFPIRVSPAPDTVMRMFMDYMPLSQKPDVMPDPQHLEKIIRHGFTLVEWGGRMHP